MSALRPLGACHTVQIYSRIEPNTPRASAFFARITNSKTTLVTLAVMAWAMPVDMLHIAVTVPMCVPAMRTATMASVTVSMSMMSVTSSTFLSFT